MTEPIQASLVDGKIVLFDPNLKEIDSDYDFLNILQELHMNGHSTDYLIQYAADNGFKLSEDQFVELWEDNE